MNPCDGPNFITEKRRAIDIMVGRYISPTNLSPMLEAKYLKWRKASRTKTSGGMILIPKSIGNNGAIMELMKSLSCQLLREAFLKSVTVASRMKLICQSDLLREVRSQRSLSNQTFYFLWINPFSPRQLRGRRLTRQSRRSPGDFLVPSTGPMQSRSPMRPPQSPPYWRRALSRAPPGGGGYPCWVQEESGGDARAARTSVNQGVLNLEEFRTHTNLFTKFN